jgi:hypothetical protein
MRIVSIGLRAKTGRAIAVVLGGQADSPQALRRGEVILVDPKAPATSQPYHEVMGLPWEEAKVAVRGTAAIIEAVASEALERLVRELRSDGLTVCGVGIVGAGDRNLEAIGGAHIRAHAAEGVLFRQVLESAAKANRLPIRRLVEKGLPELAAAELGRPDSWLRERLAEFGNSVGRPWRADEKAAAMAAWLALAAYGKGQ